MFIVPRSVFLQVTIARVPPVTAIIPTLDEERYLGPTIAAAREAGVEEIIVSDGGSRDATVEVARAHGAAVLTGERVRARQLNQGAEAAKHDILLFLHADTLLPIGAADAIVDVLDAGFVFGGFRVAFPEQQLRHVAFMINLRTRITRAPWGDQAQFTRRSTFREIGRYPEIPIMEDYELARRMKHRGPIALLPLTAHTSGRRFLRKGVLRTTATNWLIITSYHLGVSPERLARWYRSD